MKFTNRPIRLLVADNLPEMLDTEGEFLERAGYLVTCAPSYDAAKKVVNSAYFHVAVLDLRLKNNSDGRDLSGLELARQISPAVAKIILTAFPAYETARDSLGRDKFGQQAAVEYVAKSEPSRLLDSVERAFSSLGIRRDLPMTWNGVDRTTWIEQFQSKLAEPNVLNERLEEAEDLISKLFPKASEIYIERLIWQDAGRSAILARAMFPSTIAKFFVIIFGAHKVVTQEAERFSDLGLDNSWMGVPVLERRAASVRFGANLFAFPGVDLANAHSLGDVLQYEPEERLHAVVQQFLEQVLPPWIQRPPLESAEPLGETYSRRLGIQVTPDLFARVADKIKDQVAGLGLRFDIKSGSLHVWVKGRELTLPDPGPLLCQEALRHTVPLYSLPGVLDDQNILVDQEGRVGLTNFPEVVTGPLLSPFVELEAAVRFDWNEGQDFSPLFEISSILAADDFVYTDINTKPSLHKQLRVVRQIRQHAREILNGNYSGWYAGLLFQIAARIIHAGDVEKLGAARLAYQAHLVLAAALIAKRMTENKESLDRLRLDPGNRVAIVDGRRVPLPAKLFGLLKCLYEHCENVCTPEVLVREGLKEPLLDLSTLKVRLNQDISRLRKEIEKTPKSPIFLCTESGGYKLYRNPRHDDPSS